MTILGCSADRDLPPAPEDAGSVELVQPKLRVELRVETPIIKEGEMPQFSVYLVNEGAKAVTVVLPGDGSDLGWRTPILRWNPPKPPGSRCGNINALKADEVVTLSAGQRVPLAAWGRPKLTGPGKHNVSLELENVPDLRWKGVPLGKHDAAAMEKVQRSSPFRVMSNVVEVQVEE